MKSRAFAIMIDLKMQELNKKYPLVFRDIMLGSSKSIGKNLRCLSESRKYQKEVLLEVENQKKNAYALIRKNAGAKESQDEIKKAKSQMICESNIVIKKLKEQQKKLDQLISFKMS